MSDKFPSCQFGTFGRFELVSYVIWSVFFSFFFFSSTQSAATCKLYWFLKFKFKFSFMTSLFVLIWFGTFIFNSFSPRPSLSNCFTFQFPTVFPHSGHHSSHPRLPDFPLRAYLSPYPQALHSSSLTCPSSVPLKARRTDFASGPSRCATATSLSYDTFPPSPSQAHPQNGRLFGFEFGTTGCRYSRTGHYSR